MAALDLLRGAGATRAGAHSDGPHGGEVGRSSSGVRKAMSFSWCREIRAQAGYLRRPGEDACRLQDRSALAAPPDEHVNGLVGDVRAGHGREVRWLSLKKPPAGGYALSCRPTCGTLRWRRPPRRSRSMGKARSRWTTGTRQTTRKTGKRPSNEGSTRIAFARFPRWRFRVCPAAPVPPPAQVAARPALPPEPTVNHFGLGRASRARRSSTASCSSTSTTRGGS